MLNGHWRLWKKTSMCLLWGREKKRKKTTKEDILYIISMGFFTVFEKLFHTKVFADLSHKQ